MLWTICCVLPVFLFTLPSTCFIFIFYFSHNNSINLLSLLSHSLTISIHPSHPPTVHSSLSLVNVPLLLLSGILPSLVFILLFLPHSLSPSFLDTSRVTWTFEIGVSTLLSTSLFLSHFFPLTLLTIFYIFSCLPHSLSHTIANLLTLVHIPLFFCALSPQLSLHHCGYTIRN